MSPSRVVLLAVSLLRRLHRGPAMASDNWEELLGPAVQKKVVVDGHGDSPDLGSLVNFDWRGSVLLDDGTTGVAFAERKRATARIGDGDEIPGVELGLRHMRVGQQCLIRCESRFAYGPDGCPATRLGDADLPPNSDIEVRIKLLDVTSTTPVPDMTPEETIVEGERKKIVGNGHFERTAYKKALRAYTSAANTIAGLEFPNEVADAFLEARQLRIDCGNNIATTCVRLGDLEKAKGAAVGVLELDPVNVKALFRAGQVSSLQSNFVEARLALQKARDLSPDSTEIQAELGRLSARVKSYKAKRQAMQEKMGHSLFAGSKPEPGDHQGTGNGTGVGVGAAGRVVREEAVRLPDERAPGVDMPQGPDKAEPAVPFGAERYRGVVACVFVALTAWGVTHIVDRYVFP